MIAIKQKLSDARARKVVFLSHCLVNENTRYLGGAFRKAGIKELLDYLIDQGIGIVQMVCPEQKAWGGVDKSHIWRVFDSKGTIAYTLRGLVIPVFKFYTRYKYRRIAREVIKEVVDYSNAGFDVVGVIGVDGSPSCGVLSKLSIECSWEVMSDSSLDELESSSFNNRLYSQCLTTGSGIFIGQLQEQAKKREIKLKFCSTDIIGEMKGKPQIIDL